MPTLLPTIAPSQASLSPSMQPTAAGELFAVVGGDQCAESLYYGPAAITAFGSSTGYEYYLSTSVATTAGAHSAWTQIVTDGSTELFRIYWTFTTGAKTLAERFEDAVSSGETVDFRIVEPSGTETTFTGVTWWYSSSAGSMLSKFSASGDTFGFSYDDGLWGASSFTLNGDGSSIYPSDFWGLGNANAGDSTCTDVYKSGTLVSSTAKSLFYIGYDVNGKE